MHSLLRDLIRLFWVVWYRVVLRTYYRIRRWFRPLPQIGSSGTLVLAMSVIDALPPGKSAVSVATLNPEGKRWFRPTRLSIPTVLADHFTIDSMKICGEEQFMGSHVPAAIFSAPGGVGSLFGFDNELVLRPMKPGDRFEVTVTNHSESPQNFFAAVMGKEITPGAMISSKDAEKLVQVWKAGHL